MRKEIPDKYLRLPCCDLKYLFLKVAYCYERFREGSWSLQTGHIPLTGANSMAMESSSTYFCTRAFAPFTLMVLSETGEHSSLSDFVV